MKQKKKKRNILPALSERFGALTFGLLFAAMLFVISLLTDIPFEVICILAFFLTICIFIVIYAIYHIKKKEKAEIYLANKTEPNSLFDRTLQYYVDGTLETGLQSLGLDAIEIHVDLTDTEKCIDIQGRYKSYDLNVQLTENELAIGYSDTEPDPETIYPIDAETPYGFLLTKIREHITMTKGKFT